MLHTEGGLHRNVAHDLCAEVMETRAFAVRMRALLDAEETTITNHQAQISALEAEIEDTRRQYTELVSRIGHPSSGTSNDKPPRCREQDRSSFFSASTAMQDKTRSLSIQTRMTGSIQTEPAVLPLYELRSSLKLMRKENQNTAERVVSDHAELARPPVAVRPLSFTMMQKNQRMEMRELRGMVEEARQQVNYLNADLQVLKEQNSSQDESGSCKWGGDGRGAAMARWLARKKREAECGKQLVTAEQELLSCGEKLKVANKDRAKALRTGDEVTHLLHGLERRLQTLMESNRRERDRLSSVFAHAVRQHQQQLQQPQRRGVVTILDTA